MIRLSNMIGDVKITLMVCKSNEKGYPSKPNLKSDCDKTRHTDAMNKTMKLLRVTILIPNHDHYKRFYHIFHNLS